MEDQKIQEGTKIIEADRIEITIEPKNFIAEGKVKTTFTELDDIKTFSKKK